MTDKVIDTSKTETPEVTTDKVVTKVENANTEGEGEGEGEGEEVVKQIEEQKEQARIEQENHSKKQSRLDRRFKELTSKVHSREADVQSLRETLTEVTGEAPPERSDFKNPEEFRDAVDTYRDKIRGPKALLDQAEKDQGKAEAEYNKALVETWNDKVDEAVKDMPDYEKVVKAANIPMKAGVLKAVMRSPVGPQIAYYLANNQEEAHELISLTVEEQILEIGRLESKVQTGRKVAPDTKEKASPNPPTGSKVIGDKAPTKKSPENMSLEDYAAWRKKGGGK